MEQLSTGVDWARWKRVQSVSNSSTFAERSFCLLEQSAKNRSSYRHPGAIEPRVRVSPVILTKEMIEIIRFRYIVNEVDQAVEFYTSNFDFKVEEQYGKAIAILERDGVQLIVSGPMASASKPMPDGTKPSPGGWSRIVSNCPKISSYYYLVRP